MAAQSVRFGSKTDIGERFDCELFGERNPVFVWLDCRVAALLAMTIEGAAGPLSHALERDVVVEVGVEGGGLGAGLGFGAAAAAEVVVRA